MDLVNVEVECPCPGTPHEHDTVGLRPKLSLRAGVMLQSFLRRNLAPQEGEPAPDQAEVIGLLTEGFVSHGVASWSFVDAKGKPVPVNEKTIAEILLSDFALATPVADQADELYGGPVIDPLLVQVSTSSPDSQTDPSTSANGANGSKPKKRSKRSSTSTSPMADTATTSR